MSAARQSLVQRNALSWEGHPKKKTTLGRKRGKIQWKKQDLTKMEIFFSLRGSFLGYVEDVDGN